MRPFVVSVACLNKNEVVLWEWWQFSAMLWEW